MLLDTNAALWLSTDTTQLSARSADAIRTERRVTGRLSIASSSLWEVAMLSARGKIVLPSSLADYLRFLEKTFVVLPITGAIAEQSVAFSDRYPRDPSDRLIGATAVVHGGQLVTSDKAIRDSGEVNCIW